jgi:hypothetical protein
MWDVSIPHKVRIEGRGELMLTPNSHVASGGEGHVYRPKNGSMAVKIWEDAGRAISGRMPEKINLLSKLAHKWIVAPEALIKDDGGRPVGYVMPWVDGWALPLAFTNDWRTANKFTDDNAATFASKMREVVTFTHSHGAIMGDPNELNILGVGNDPRYIDVDPWVLPGYPGDKILPTIRDWHSPLFTQEADWFAWAVVTFQLFVGVHPYRGGHPDFKKADLEGRMKANASVLNPKVSLSPAVRPFSSIPPGMIDWYKAVFNNGERSLPPDPVATKAVRVLKQAVLKNAGNLQVSMLGSLPSPVTRLATHDSLILQDGTLISLPEMRKIGQADPQVVFIRLADGGIGGAMVIDGKVHTGVLYAAPGAKLAMVSSDLAANQVWVASNRLFAVTADGILELSIRHFAGRMTVLTANRWALNGNSTIFGDGVAVWSALGAQYIVLPQDKTSVAIVRAKALDGFKVMSSVGHGRIAVISMIDKAGSYKRAVAVLAEDLLSCTISVTDADDGMLTDVITGKGIILRQDSQGKLEVSLPMTGGLMTLDPGAITDGLLISSSSGVYCTIDSALFKLSMV